MAALFVCGSFVAGTNYTCWFVRSSLSQQRRPNRAKSEPGKNSLINGDGEIQLDELMCLCVMRLFIRCV